jgi:hypothetical protein
MLHQRAHNKTTNPPTPPHPHLDVLYASAASVGIFDISRMHARSCCAGSWTSEVDE